MEANEKNMPVLHLATQKGHEEIVHVLLNTFSEEEKDK